MTRREQSERKWELAKRQTFGMEIEMYHISIVDAAKAVAKHFGVAPEYVGGAYHKWLVTDGEGRKWDFGSDSSISDDDARRGTCEMASPVLTYADMSTLQKVIRVLRKAGAKSDAAHSCGVHVHVGLTTKDGCETMDAKQLINLSNWMYTNERLVAAGIGVDGSRLERWCKPMDPAYVGRIAELWDKIKRDPGYNILPVWGAAWYDEDPCRHRQHYDPSRYRILNLHAVLTKGTVEFRCFQFDSPDGERKNGLHAGQARAYVQMALMIVAHARLATRVRAGRKVFAANPKYYMWHMMNQLGLIGDEFKVCRDVFMKKVEGDSSYHDIDGRAALEARRAEEAIAAAI